jgi:hypothetical protein
MGDNSDQELLWRAGMKTDTRIKMHVWCVLFIGVALSQYLTIGCLQHRCRCRCQLLAALQWTRAPAQAGTQRYQLR